MEENISANPSYHLMSLLIISEVLCIKGGFGGACALKNRSLTLHNGGFDGCMLIIWLGISVQSGMLFMNHELVSFHFACCHFVSCLLFWVRWGWSVGLLVVQQPDDHKG